MQTAFVLIPAVLFFGAYKLYDFYVATAALMVSVTVLTAIEWIRTRETNKLHLVSTVMLWVLGGITLVLRDPAFLMWKFSIYHWVIALYLLYTQYYREKTGLQAFFELLGQFSAGNDPEDLDFSKMPEHKFRTANMISVVYFTLIGVINLIIAFGMGEAAWVNFKVFGITILNFFYLMGLMMWLFAGEFSKDKS